jgi:hypothetical protein
MSEYLVEVTPGRESLYRTPLSLRAAIRSGEITADSRIFHRATRTWISITEHPEYKRFRSEVNPPPRRRRFLDNFVERGAALATSSWASLKRRFDSKARKPAGSRKPAKPARPVPPAQPAPEAPQAEPQNPDSLRKRWTFFP